MVFLYESIINENTFLYKILTKIKLIIQNSLILKGGWIVLFKEII